MPAISFYSNNCSGLHEFNIFFMTKHKKPEPKKKPAKGNFTMGYRPRSLANTTNKIRRPFGDPVALAKADPNFVVIPKSNIMPGDLSYDLAHVLSPGQIKKIVDSGKLVFHCVGDTGDINNLGITRDLALQMESQFANSQGVVDPSFFYHLGDVVYYNGISTDYRDQFYDPYKFYPELIFAIPGNHDGQTIINKGDPPDPEPSLKGFFENFCAAKRVQQQSSPYRYTMDQPWPFWTLLTPFATFIGLYSNVEGTLDKWNDKSHPQFSWFIQAMQKADPQKCLVLSVHHSPFSLDDEHGGYPDILDAIDQAVAKSGGRYPDIVLSGHVHNFQRFQRKINSESYIHIVAGAGGYASIKTMHKLQLDPKTNTKIPQNTLFQTTLPDVALLNYNDSLPGFLRITVDQQLITGEYFINDTSSGTQSPDPFDSFKFNYKSKKIL
jgi:predicted phosphodiesterase